MSQVIDTIQLDDGVCSDYIQTSDGKYYYVDSRYAFDRGFETMAFECKKSFRIPRKSWQNPVYENHYKTETEMIESHKRLIHNFEAYLNKEGVKL